MALRIRRGTQEELAPYRLQASRDGAHLEAWNKPLLQWYIAELDGEFVGCVGMIEIGKRLEARVRGWYVLEEHRGKGIGSALIKAFLCEAKRMGFQRAEAKTRHVEIMRKWGWVSTGKVYTSEVFRGHAEQFVFYLQPPGEKKGAPS